MTTEKRPSIFPLLWVMLFDHTSLTMTFPILTLLFFDTQSRLFLPETSHAVRSMWYGFCVAIPHIVNIGFTPILSALSDDFGRKKILLIGTLGAFLFALTAAFGIMWGMLSLLFLGRVIQGLFSRTNPIAQAVIGDISTPQNKVLYMGYLQLAISVGAFFGPVIGGYFANQLFFEQFNFSLPYFIAAFLGGISCLLTFFFFKETAALHYLTKTGQSIKFNTMKRVLFDPQVLSISAILLLSQISWSFYYQFIPPILKTVLGFNAHALGIFVGLIAFWLALATAFGIALAGRWLNLYQLLLTSLYLVLAGVLLTFFFCLILVPTAGYAIIWLAAIPTAMGDVIAYSCLTTLYSNAVGKDEQGKVMGVCFIVVGSVWSLTALVGGFLMSFHPLLPLMVAPLGVILSIILLQRNAIFKLEQRFCNSD